MKPEKNNPKSTAHDVHEQRQADQTREAVVTTKKDPRPQQPSQTELDRADAEGMGQPQGT